jgi:hypothetical protein
MSAGVFLGRPVDYFTIPMELIENEIEAMNADVLIMKTLHFVLTFNYLAWCTTSPT